MLPFIFIELLFFMIIVVFIIGNHVFNEVVHMSSNDTTRLQNEKVSLERKGFNFESIFIKYIVENVKIISSLDGHTIPGDFIRHNFKVPRGVMIFVHGIGQNRISMYPLAEVFLERGYDVLLFDQRASGENIAKYNTYGVLESKDVIDCVHWLDKQTEADIIVWGISMGAASTGISLSDEYINHRIKGAILECPISDMKQVILCRMKKMKLKLPITFLLLTGSLINKLRLGFWYTEVNVCSYTQQAQVPVIVLNTLKDNITPYKMGIDIFISLTNSKSCILTVNDSRHANVFLNHTVEVLSIIDKCIGL